MSACFSQIFRFDSGSSIRLLLSKIENIFVPSMMRFTNVAIIVAAPASRYKHFLEPQLNVFVNISHSSCTCNGNDVGLLIKTKSIEKRMMTQTTIRNF